MMIKPRILLSLSFLLILFGCSSTPEPIVDVEWQAHQQKLQQIQTYQVIGKIGYISPEQRETLNFQWQKSPNKSQLRLTNFLGQTVLSLSMDAKGATVETYDDQKFNAANGQILIYQLTGLDIPIDDLQDWVLGLPTKADYFKLNENNTLASLDKTSGRQNWHVDYTRYKEFSWQNGNIPLPDRMQLTQQQTSIKLVISKWILTP
ncbi:lipoprotein insertase outer membrane protein LolB [Vibrio plantisponsor]|jgi:outer membrane lipoprotein LolB|uniref:Outer-membrane lipoprotein LolB n=1 Tax=Vibrio plantisponsor TaxID=664643 RepID=A0ABU4IHV1_9VIBR|nr:lipoprotein insertase outer membrane protein LolB [Vibrio plantisponsor]MDW6017799.1 lipoprotein insertase outer membrane protein LolB [Vibrio plantisponsor]NNM40632.1 lipoprotein localization protein LolB [Vibrio plantisponsor]